MNKMIYVAAALMGLPLYGMEQAKPAEQIALVAQAAAKTASAEQVEEYILAAQTGNIQKVLAFVREFPACIDRANSAGKPALFAAIEGHLTAEQCVIVKQSSSCLRIFTNLVRKGATTQIRYRDTSVIEFLKAGCTYKTKVATGNETEAWEGLGDIEQYAQKFMESIEDLSEEGRLRAQETKKREELLRAGIKVASQKQVDDFVEAAFRGELDKVEAFVQEFPACIDFKSSFGSGHTALFEAVDGGFWSGWSRGLCYEVFEYLLLKGADVQITRRIEERGYVFITDFIKMGRDKRLKDANNVYLKDEKAARIKQEEEWANKWLDCLSASPQKIAQFKADEEARKAQAEKEAQEKAIALALFNQKRQDARKAKDEAKLTASLSLKVAEESKQLEAAVAEFDRLSKECNDKLAGAERLATMATEAREVALRATQEAEVASKRVEELKKKLEDVKRN